MLGTAAFAVALAAWTHPSVAFANLLANGNFDVDVEPWADPFPDDDAIVSWSPLDAEASPTSGSLQVQTTVPNGAADGPASECIPATPGSYTLAGSVFRASGPALTQVYLDLEFYASPTCLGDPIEEASTFANELDVWEPFTLTGTAPEGTSAVHVRALVGGTHDTIPDVGRFDRLVLTPEPGAAPLAGAAALALALRGGRGARRHGGQRVPQ